MPVSSNTVGFEITHMYVDERSFFITQMTHGFYNRYVTACDTPSSLKKKAFLISYCVAGYLLLNDCSSTCAEGLGMWSLTSHTALLYNCVLVRATSIHCHRHGYSYLLKLIQSRD